MVSFYPEPCMRGRCCACSGSLAAEAKLNYRPERVYLQRHFDVGTEYRVQGVYCVILCRQPPVPMHYPRTKCFYLSEGSADRAVTTASIENPNGVRLGSSRPSNLLVCRKVIAHTLRLIPGTWPRAGAALAKWSPGCGV